MCDAFSACDVAHRETAALGSTNGYACTGSAAVDGSVGDAGGDRAAAADA